MTEWLEVEASIRQSVTVSPRTSASVSVHKGADRPEDFDAASWPATLTRDSGVQRQPIALPEGLEPTLRGPAERLVAARVQQFTSQPIHRVSYGLRTGSGVVDVVGDAVAPVGTDWRPLKRRRTIVMVAAAVVVLATVLLVKTYLGQSAWYERFGGDRAAAMGLAGALAAAAVAVLVGVGLLPRGARRRWTLGGSACGALLAVVVAVLAWSTGGPTAEAARAALAAGDLERASFEAVAVLEVGGDRGGAADVLDEEHLQRAVAASDAVALAAVVRQPWEREAARGKALALLAEAQEKRKAQLLARADAAGLDALGDAVGGLLLKEQYELRWRAAFLRADACLASHDYGCVAARVSDAAKWGAPEAERRRPLLAAQQQTEQRYRAALEQTSARPLAARRGALASAIEAGRDLALFAPESPTPAPAELERQLGGVDALIAADTCGASRDYACVTERLTHAERAGAGSEDVRDVRDRAASTAEAALRDALKRATDRELSVQRAALTDALAASTGCALITGRPASTKPDAISKRIARTDSELERRRLRAVRAAAAEAARAERAAERRERLDAPLLCCDGTYSPTCTCGGRRRGCCSRHRGVCGCSG